MSLSNLVNKSWRPEYLWFNATLWAAGVVSSQGIRSSFEARAKALGVLNVNESLNGFSRSMVGASRKSRSFQLYVIFNVPVSKRGLLPVFIMVITTPSFNIGFFVDIMKSISRLWGPGGNVDQIYLDHVVY